MKGSTRAISRILIANRGEIARRIIRTCRVLNIETVAVFSEVDRHSPHVKEADSAQCIGAPMNYLSIESIVSAAKKSGADAVHPGYGFLSENPALPEALTELGIHFIGPTAATIRALGSKTNAKQLATLANVPIAPTLFLNDSAVRSTAESNLAKVRSFTEEFGFPIMIKAAAGGGGRGMRLVSKIEECSEALESAQRESQKAFGSSEIFIERFIANARHIEVQIAGDIYGDVVALGTRDCSLQRNNQKIVEEAPALGLYPGADEEISLAASRLAKASGYSNLGTVEFLYTEDGRFYFLEVNTRLQVEHPVTELVTSLDLVKLQIRLASGESLKAALDGEDAPVISGHAIEARLCAEEYIGRFTTSTGIILDMEIPRGPLDSGLVRADIGYEVCLEVSHYYDSLLGKIVVHAPSRPEAIELLRKALCLTRVLGVGTNRSLLLHLISTEAFSTQAHTVQNTASLLPAPEELHEQWLLSHLIVAAVRVISPQSNWSNSSPWLDPKLPQPLKLAHPLSTSIHGMRIRSLARQTESGIEVTIIEPSQRESLVRVAKSSLPNTNSHPHLESYSVSIDRSAAMPVKILIDGAKIWVHTPSYSVALTLNYTRTRSDLQDAQRKEVSIVSPIPGKIATISVELGAHVNQGDLLITLDSMKMEHPIRAPGNGVVTSLKVSLGEVIQAGEELLVLAIKPCASG